MSPLEIVKPILVSFSVAVCSGVSTQPAAEYPAVVGSDRPVAHIIVREAAVNFPISHTMDGYEINCRATLIAAWGKPFELNKENPKASTITIVDVSTRTVRAVIQLDKGVHLIEYAKDPRYAVVWMDLAALINTESGTLSAPEGEANGDVPLEECEAFPHKSFRRYSD